MLLFYFILTSFFQSKNKLNVLQANIHRICFNTLLVNFGLFCSPSVDHKSSGIYIFVSLHHFLYFDVCLA